MWARIYLDGSCWATSEGKAVGAAGCSGTGSGSGPQTKYAVRVVLASSLSNGDIHRYSDIMVSSNTKDSLVSIYSDSNVRSRVRSGFNATTKREVESGRKELVLTYRNHANERVYFQYPVKDLFMYNVSDLIESIPRDNNGPIDGAAFPITLVIETRDCFSDTDGEFM